ncbi:hypothetical protein RM553_10670 [Zunongwangia sp. F363]|uniref:Lipocalin-like domain-containing protein n=1 Tax=Autumnicola tepida TaxID=3075595 RepID=A0ABU3CAC7_9FLAO|nr:hypothetical protein [Zunongwangia sp. F363]MDT0643292.1 hypothetical protein [Zunongwangia sp. F363]
MKKVLFIGIFCSMLIMSCSPNVVGTWNIDRYEVDNQKGQNFTTRNAGELVINKNGTGEKNVEYNMFQNEFSDAQDFRWTMQGDDLITITSTNSYENSDFDKTWIMVTNKKKEQVWKSTDGKNSVQVLELSKK